MNLYVICEDVFVDDKIKLLSEERVQDVPKVKYKTILQTIGDTNKNRRIYPKPVAEMIVQQLLPIAKNRSLYGELDHPFVVESSDPKTMQSVKRRMLRRSLQDAAILITNLEIDGNIIYGECETLSFSKGPDVYKALVIDNVNLGHSLRTFASLRPLPDGRFEVVPPVHAITYDVVSDPSHSKARVVEIAVEDVMNLSEGTCIMEEESELLTEDYQIYLERDKIVLCDNNRCWKVLKEDIINEMMSKVVAGLRIIY